MTRRTSVAVLAASVALAAALPLSACGTAGWGPVTSVACASWAGYETDAERAAASDAVVVVTDVREEGTARIFGFDANAYRARVVVAEKGDIAVGDTIRIGSTPDTCAASPYGEGDPMLSGDPLRVFLSDDGAAEGWWTLSPFDGVRPATPEDGDQLTG